MTEPPDFERWLVDNWPRIEAAIAKTARRQGIRDDDADDFTSWVTLRLVEHDYALLRKWRGESTLHTYLVVVLQNLGREYRVQRWGRWRPSAAAVRLGPVALLLERLVRRDGMTLTEAAERMRTAGATGLTDHELGAILRQLPVRDRARVVDDSASQIAAVADRQSADDALLASEADDAHRELLRGLLRCVAALPSEPQVVVRMHFLAGYTLADVARALAIPQKPLYRVKDQALRRLARCLADGGFDGERVRGLLGGPLPDPAAGENAPPRPSKESRDARRDDRADGSSDAARSEGVDA